MHRRTLLIFGLVFLFFVIAVSPVEAQPSDPPEFEIETVNGEPADQVNEIEFHDDAPIVIELDGADVSEHRFNVSIGEHDYQLFPDDEGKLEAGRENPPEGQYTMTMTLIHWGEETTSAETEIEITDAGDRRDGDLDEKLDPSEFEIETVNGESADQLNEIEFHRDAPMTIELDGVNVSKYRFNVSIGEYVYPLFPDDEGELRPRRGNPPEGQYTMTVTLIHRGEPVTSAATEIEIIDAGKRRDSDLEEELEPSEFEIATINGESADQINEVEFHRDAPITIELDGANVSEHRFNVSIGEHQYPMLPDDGGELRPRRDNPPEGQYTITVTLIHRGEPATSAATEIEITDAGDERANETDPRAGNGNVSTDDLDDSPGFGFSVAFLALLSALVLLRVASRTQN
jgi:hypothetical protein